jgi:aspartate ammonia-lyase
MPTYQLKEITMNQQNLITQAIEMTTQWDLDDEFITDVIQSQAHLLAAHDSDLIDSDYAIH